jgi:hypothetical protein
MNEAIKEPRHLYRISFQFCARNAVEAMAILNGAILDAPKITMTIVDLDRRRRKNAIWGWGISAGLFAAAFALWRIAEGLWK